MFVLIRTDSFQVSHSQQCTSGNAKTMANRCLTTQTYRLHGIYTNYRTTETNLMWFGKNIFPFVCSQKWQDGSFMCRQNTNVTLVLIFESSQCLFLWHWFKTKGHGPPSFRVNSRLNERSGCFSLENIEGKHRELAPLWIIMLETIRCETNYQDHLIHWHFHPDHHFVYGKHPYILNDHEEERLHRA